MVQLAEAYVRLRPYYVSEERLSRLGNATDEFARIGALEFYEQPVKIVVELIEGTLSTKVKVAGTIFATGFTIYAGIDGAINTTERLCKSANLFGNYVCSAFIKEAQGKPEQVERVERRLKTPGKLRRVLKRMERLDMNAPRMSKEELEAELHRAKLQLENVIKDLGDDDRRVLENLEFRRLPPYHDWPTRGDLIEAPRVALPRLEGRRSEPRLLIGNKDVLREKSRPRLEYHNTFPVSRTGAAHSVRGQPRGLPTDGTEHSP
jgi:hypothetical protein